MFAYTIRRLLVSIPILGVASFIVFWLVSIRADPVQEKYGARNPPVPRAIFDAEYRRLGLKDGFFEQYWNWLKDVVSFNTFGPSINQTTNIDAEIGDRLWTTLRLIFLAMLLALILAVLTGVFSAVRQYSKMDYTFTFLGFLFLSMPTFWIAVLLKEGAVSYNQSTGTKTFFTLGEKTPGVELHGWELVTDIAGHMVLPTISLALITYAAWSRFQRAAMLEVLNSDYIRLARAKGLRWRTVLVRHALRTALIPMVTISALTIAALIGGAVITESVYQWNGMGRFLIQSINARDRNAILAWLMLAGFFVVVGNLVADLLYAVLDPRIRYE
jgi:peptide/nickel transport system permease protein